MIGSQINAGNRKGAAFSSPLLGYHRTSPAAKAGCQQPSLSCTPAVMHAHCRSNVRCAVHLMSSRRQCSARHDTKYAYPDGAQPVTRGCAGDLGRAMRAVSSACCPWGADHCAGWTAARRASCAGHPARRPRSCASLRPAPVAAAQGAPAALAVRCAAARRCRRAARDADAQASRDERRLQCRRQAVPPPMPHGGRPKPTVTVTGWPWKPGQCYVSPAT
jgi:hypothetical protein